ncbi:LOW QUALITY PROTEIN: exocyst complex component 6 [Coregonus clupeaformis]|uniref:LOW QUALITY PROTEIN: exocyst complex component 6 n=1 Tax=Coregonus clupeaformis TaxID=59861 RepID=UPI001E1C962B|nr:LOW QUALITY PROTEIN: exocyst complex component 6 [Coregonus clupeaformis]
MSYDRYLGPPERVPMSYDRYLGPPERVPMSYDRYLGPPERVPMSYDRYLGPPERVPMSYDRYLGPPERVPMSYDRSVYDDQPNAHKRFMEKLEVRIRNHDREIEKMCNFHHQGFVDAITELLKVRADAEKLMGQVTDTNRRLQDAGREVTAQTEEVIRCRIQQRNMATTVERIQLCIPVLEMYSKLKEQLESKRYYAALKTMEQLEKVSIPRVGRYRFCQIMAENLPKLREDIKDISMSDLKDFLESIRKHSDRIGETAMKQVQQHRTFNSVVQKQDSGMGFTKPGSSLNGQTPTQNNGLAAEEDQSEEEVLTAQDLVDFSPVYRCLHIYTVLGDRETFENYYRKQRKKQARLVLQPQSNMHETVEGYRRYFNQILGFFVVEDHILHATQGLVTRAFTDELWNMALSKIIAVLRTHSSYCSDPDLVLELKNLIVIFADTLQGYGFPVNRLFDLLFEIRDQYNETLLKKWALVFREIFELDNYSPIPVETEEEYKSVISRFPFHDAEIEKQDFPKKLPMSQSVPQIYVQVKEFIYASLKFSESLHRSWTEIDDMLRKSTNLLLTRTLSGCLQNLIKKPHIGLTELVQIIINTTHLEQACKYLEDFITNITNVSPETVHTTRLYGLSTFKDARHAAEGEIYTKLNQKIDEFIQLADYDWGMPESDGQASGYLMDLINFLRSTFQVFTHLPGKVAQTACMSACKHLSTSLMQMPLDSELKQISMGAIQQFNLDVIQCELFASSEPVPGFQGTLYTGIHRLRQATHPPLTQASTPLPLTQASTPLL